MYSQILICLLLLGKVVNCQGFMDIKGNRLEGKSIHEVDSILGVPAIHVHHVSSKPLRIAGFYPLSKKPVWVYANSPSEISSILKSFDFSKYMKSFDAEIDLEKLIGKKLLDTAYVRKNLGSPDRITLDHMEVFDVWIYKNYNLAIIFNDTIAIEFERKNFKKIEQHKLSILETKVGGSDYYSDVTIKIENLSPRTIKYIWFTLTAYNAVDDAISTKTLKGVGPVARNETGEWTFELAFISRVLDYTRTVGIKIQYTDGTTHTIPRGDIIEITDRQAL